MKAHTLPFIFLLLAVHIPLVRCQQPSAPPPSAQPPQLSELEQANLKILQLEINDINRDIRDYTALFDAAHPGWSINVMNGQIFPKPATAVVKPKASTPVPAKPDETPKK
jgi:hypothetical protein